MAPKAKAKDARGVWIANAALIISTNDDGAAVIESANEGEAFTVYATPLGAAYLNEGREAFALVNALPDDAPAEDAEAAIAAYVAAVTPAKGTKGAAVGAKRTLRPDLYDLSGLPESWSPDEGFALFVPARAKAPKPDARTVSAAATASRLASRFASLRSEA